jgi:tetratricopeptide (TPR) repeat protein
MKDARRPSADDLRKKAEQKHKRKGLGEAASLYHEAAQAFIAQDKADDAIAMLSDALAEPPKNERSSHQQRELRRLLAETLTASGQSNAAISEYEEYLKLGTPDVPSLRALAELYIGAGKSNIAIDRLRRAIERSIAQGDIVGAADAAGRIAELTPESLDAAVQHALLLRNVGDDGVLPALEHLAALYRDNEKLSQEVATCREILGLAPGREDIRRRLASLYTRILEMDPHDDDAWHGLRSLDPELADQVGVLLMDELADRNARSKAG